MRLQSLRPIPRVLMLAFLGFLFVSPPHVWAFDLESVLQGTRIAPPARVRFREERHNQLLKEALILTGYLEYLEKGQLRKVVESPFQETLLISGDKIEIVRDGETRTLSAKHSRSLRTMLAGIEAILAGQEHQLLAAFSPELTGTTDAWSLALRPRSNRIAKQLVGLQVGGDADAVRSIRIDLSEDEWHRMEIIPEDTEQ
jgi:hypothetical protein